MEQQESGRLADKAAAVAAVATSTQRAAATVKGGVRKGSSSKRQRSASPSSAATANSNSGDDEAANSNNSDAAVAATGEMPWGSSWWDKLPAEIRIMILDFVGPLQRFLTGQLGTKEQLETSYEARATAKSIWVDALKRDWKGNLDLLPNTLLSVKEGLCEAHSRSMYERLYRRFPDRQTLCTSRFAEPSHCNSYHYNDGVKLDEYSLLNIPARHGWFDLLDFKHPITLGWFVIKYGHAALLRHLAFMLKVVDLSQFKRFHHENVMDVAAGSGSLEIVQMLHDAGNNNCTAYAMDWAATGGHLDVLQWLHANRREGCTELASCWAAMNGCLHIVEWLVEHYPSKIDKDAVTYAARKGHVDILAFLLSRFPDVDVQAAIQAAAREGHVDVLAFLLARFPDLDVQDAIEKAASWGCLTVIKWFHAHRPDAFTPRAFREAVKHFHTDIVQFLLDNRYAFDIETIFLIKDPAFRKLLFDNLTLDRARALLEDAKTRESGYKMIAKSLEAAVKRLEKAKAKADKEAIPKKQKISSK